MAGKLYVDRVQAVELRVDRRLAGAACAALSLLVAFTGCVGNAQARTKHVFEGPSFCPAGTGAGQCNGAMGVAVSDVTHDVYVVDSGNDRVDQFSAGGASLVGEFNGSSAPTGQFSQPTEIAVDNSSDPSDPSREDVYVVDTGHNAIDKFSPSGSYIGQLTGTTCATPPGNDEVLLCPKSGAVHPFSRLVGVAVDPDGTVWVDEKEGNVSSFSDATINEPVSIRVTEFGRFGILPGLAVDSAEDIYLNPNDISKVTSEGAILLNPFCGNENEFAEAVALDPLRQEGYVDHLSTIGECSEAGALIEVFGSGHLTNSAGVAVDASAGEPTSGTVYASTSEAAGEVALFAAVAFPTAITGEPSEQTTTGATLNASVNPEGHPIVSCVFEYDTVPYAEGPKEEPPATHGTTVPCSPSSLGSGTKPVPVSAHLSGLVPEMQYYYVVRVANAAGEGTSCEAEHKCQQFFTGPILNETFMTDVTSTSATFHAVINPNGDDTHYYFEYGTSEAYGSVVPQPPPGEDLGGGKGLRSVPVHVHGLSTGTEYHYRLVVEQAGEVFEKPARGAADNTFTTQAAGTAGLPDGRAWELVSPAEKKGALIEFFPGFSVALQAASDGHGIAYEAAGQLGENPVGKSPLSYVLSSRLPGGGWHSRDLTLPDRLPPEGDEPANLNGGVEYPAFSRDLALAAVEPHRYMAPLSPEVSERTLYLFDTAETMEGGFAPLVTPANTAPGTLIGTENPEPIRIYAATPDLTHLVLRSPVTLTEGARSEYYEWSGGKLLPVGVLPGGTPFEGSMNVAGTGFEFGSAQRGMSDDGRWIAWTAGDPYTTPNVPLYVRNMVSGETTQVGGLDARFQTMTSDGSKIFYIEDGDLYEFETATDQQFDLTASHGPGEPSAGVQEDVSDVSEDGSYLYFVATGVLGAGAASGQPNLYLLHDESGVWSTTHIATLSPEDEKSWHGFSFAPGTSATALALVSSRVSPDGKFLAFMSERSLTGYDNRDAVSDIPDEEVYLYDAKTNRLVCASCNPTGARPHGILDRNQHEPLVDRAGSWSARQSAQDHWLAGSIPGWDEGLHNRSMYQPRYLSNSGRLFFDSPDELVPQATNGLENVYEYEPPTVGSCAEASTAFKARSSGCTSLLSSGISSFESAFYDASEDGDDVFFITTAKLVHEDFDAAYDVYDAHMCSTAVPCRSETESPPRCDSGDSCKPPPSRQPETFGPPPSATFSGTGNVVAAASKAMKPPLSRAQRLARALKGCRRKVHRKRLTCERQARKRYGTKSRHRRASSGRRGR